MWNWWHWIVEWIRRTLLRATLRDDIERRLRQARERLRDVQDTLANATSRLKEAKKVVGGIRLVQQIEDEIHSANTDIADETAKITQLERELAALPP